MKNEPTNNPWPYDTRPAADQGRDEATFDGKGSLVALPEKERALSDWDRLKEVLYQFGRRGHEHMTPDRFFEEHKFDELAHSIREGWKDAKNSTRATWCLADRNKRHAQKPSQNPCEDDSMEADETHQVSNRLVAHVAETWEAMRRSIERQRSGDSNQVADTILDRALSDVALYGSGVLHGGKHVPLSLQRHADAKVQPICAYCGAGDGRHTGSCLIPHAKIGIDMAREPDRTTYFQPPRQEGKSITATQAREKLKLVDELSATPAGKRPAAYTVQDGGDWIEGHPPYNVNVFATLYEDGSIYCKLSGWRKLEHYTVDAVMARVREKRFAVERLAEQEEG